MAEYNMNGNGTTKINTRRRKGTSEERHGYLKVMAVEESGGPRHKWTRWTHKDTLMAT